MDTKTTVSAETTSTSWKVTDPLRGKERLPPDLLELRWVTHQLLALDTGCQRRKERPRIGEGGRWISF